MILGLLQKQPMSGYDIKAHVDISTRFFFPSSYSQIYPELKRLEADGLVEGTELANGRRARTEYAITASGQEAFDAWIRMPDATYEIRDLGLLKFFFGGGLERDELLAKLEAMREVRMAELQRLKSIGRAIPEIADELQRATLDYGIGLQKCEIAWCEKFAELVRSRDPSEFPVERGATGRVAVRR